MIFIHPYEIRMMIMWVLGCEKAKLLFVFVEYLFVFNIFQKVRIKHLDSQNVSSEKYY